MSTGTQATSNQATGTQAASTQATTTTTTTTSDRFARMCLEHSVNTMIKNERLAFDFTAAHIFDPGGDALG